MSSEPDPLQFEKAEFSAPPAQNMSCAVCTRGIPDRYFEIGGKPICASCKEQIGKVGEQGTSASRFLRALGAGLGAAIVGAGLYYAVLAITGYELGLIAIVVGVMVGSAVRWGAQRRGGWVYQALAMGLTYLSITSTYVPLIVKEMQKPKDEAAQSAAAPETTPPAADPAAPALIPTDVNAEPEPTVAAEAPSPSDAPAPAPDPAPAMGVLGLVLGMVLLLMLAMAAPFLAGLENIIGLVIIGFALYEAWKINKRIEIVVSGPFPVPAAAPAAVLAGPGSGA